MKTLPTRRGTVLKYNDGNKQTQFKILGQGRCSSIYRVEDLNTHELTTIIIKFANGTYNQFLERIL